MHKLKHAVHNVGHGLRLELNHVAYFLILEEIARWVLKQLPHQMDALAKAASAAVLHIVNVGAH